MRLPVRGVTAAMCVALLASCSAPRRKFDPEEFGSTTTRARKYAVVEAKTCEAARRALFNRAT